MNKLDEISAQSPGKRLLVRAVKLAITACGAACMIAIAVNIRHSGGITLALDHTASEAEVRYLDTVASRFPLPASGTAVLLPALDEATLAWQQTAAGEPVPQIPEQPLPAEDESAGEEIPGEDIPDEEPSYVLRAPDGWKGWATTFDEDGKVSIYGEELTEKKGAVTDGITGQTGGTMDVHEGVGGDYFADALFIGNSLVVGMEKSGTIETEFYSTIGLSVYGFFEKSFLPAPDGTGEKVTALEAFVRSGGYPKVYLMFGINELGWPSANAFIKQYAEVIDALLTVRPDATIYVQGILPINETVYRSSPDAQSYITNERIAEFNASLEAMAAEKQVFFVNPGEALSDENGQLVQSATSDGIHLSGIYLAKWANYLKAHTVREPVIEIPEAVQ